MTAARSEPGGLAARIEGVLHRVGVRLLSQDRLRLLAGLATIATLAVNGATMSSLYGAVVPIALVVAMLQSGSLGWALSRPRLAVGTSTIAAAATTVLTAGGAGSLPWPIPVVTLVTVALTVFVLAVRESWGFPVAAAALPVAASALAARLSGGWGSYTTNLVTAVAVLALVAMFGILVHQWLLSRAELQEQQELAASEQDRRLLVEERNRIARELHDVVAHGLSVISIQASTLQYRLPDVPAAVVVELDDITDSARRALVEMRGLLAVLRQEGEDDIRTPQPSMSSVRALVASTRRSAETVRLDVSGELAGSGVSEATSLSVYRIVQEALSNALRHAPGSEIDVAITIDDDQVVVEVENTRPTSPTAAPTGEGFGLRGMRERVSYVRGTLSTDPTPDGGFLVRAVLPARHRHGPDERIPPQ